MEPPFRVREDGRFSKSLFYAKEGRGDFRKAISIILFHVSSSIKQTKF